MILKKISDYQPKNFEFTAENLTKANKIILKYPKGKKSSAVMPLLSLAQKQNDNWLPLSAIKYIAKLLDMPYISVYEVVTFYSMYNLKPVGQYFIQVCTTTPCMIMGSKNITDICKKYISAEQNKLSKNSKCSWTEVECLGACVNAPMMQVNDDYYEDLNIENTEKIIKGFIDDKPLKPGSYRNRKNTAPEKSRLTLLKNFKNA